MVIVTEKKSIKQEGSTYTEWEIPWKKAFEVFKMLSMRRDFSFYERGFGRTSVGDRPRSPLGDQPIVELKISGNDLFIYGKQTGYIIFGSQVDRIIRTRFEPSALERMTLFFSPSKELVFDWGN
jgi:hypothetical protein